MHNGPANRNCPTRLRDFVLEEESGVFTHPQTDSDAEREPEYRDGAEEHLLNVFKNTTDLTACSESLQKEARDWPTQYHLGQERSHILKALGIEGNLKVLELGCGCGALSRYLGETCRAVDCVEGSLTRAKICRERCRDLNNVRVYHSKISEAMWEPAYDIVTLIGVLEYAPMYFSGLPQQACSKLLEAAGSALNADGVLLTAIENRIGLKYWTGAPDDHTNTLFDGLHGYPAKKSAVTFSKKELQSLLSHAALEHIHFYHCFPDYKFASTVFSSLGDDELMYLHNWIDVPFKQPQGKREYNMHEGLVLRTLSKAGLLRQLANSLLIVASKTDVSCLLKPNWIAKKISGFPRRRQYRCITTLNISNGLSIEKKKFDDNKPIKGDLTAVAENPLVRHSAANSPWYPGDLLLYDIYEALLSCDFRKHLIEILDRYYRELISRFHTGKTDSCGYPLLHGACFDFVPRNIVNNDNELVPIDEEWSCRDEIPADYVLFRCINNDIVSTQYPYMKKQRGDSRNFTIEIIRVFLPQYNKRRYKQNEETERNLLATLTVS